MLKYSIQIGSLSLFLNHEKDHRELWLVEIDFEWLVAGIL